MTTMKVSTLKRIVTLFLTLVLVFSMNLFTIQTALAEEEGYSVTFQISLHKNWIKSKYGVTVYLDGVVVEHIKQGDMITFGARLTDGWHELTFVPGKSSADVRTWKIGYLQDGCTVSCTLQTHRKDIEIRQSSIKDRYGNNFVSSSSNRDADTAGKVLDLAGKAIILYLKIKSGK